MGRSALIWFADDGEEFKTQKDMLLHELLILDNKEIEAFLETELDVKERKRGEYKKVLVAWQTYVRSTQKIPLDVDNKPSLEELYNVQTVEEHKPDNYILGETPVDETADIDASFKAALPI